MSLPQTPNLSLPDRGEHLPPRAYIRSAHDGPNAFVGGPSVIDAPWFSAKYPRPWHGPAGRSCKAYGGTGWPQLGNQPGAPQLGPQASMSPQNALINLAAAGFSQGPVFSYSTGCYD